MFEFTNIVVFIRPVNTDREIWRNNRKKRYEIEKEKKKLWSTEELNAKKEKERESLEKENVKTLLTIQRRTLANLTRNHPKLVSVLTGLTDSAQI